MKYRNPNNKPDKFEEKVLKSFESNRNKKEHSEYTKEGNITYLRLLKPLALKKNCLACHGSPDSIPPIIQKMYGHDLAAGYKEGDIRGAISFKMVSSTDKPASKFRKDLLNSVTLFEKSLKALKSGGIVPFGKNNLNIEPLITDEISSKIKAIENIFYQMKRNVTNLVSAKIGSHKFLEARTSILELNPSLLKESHALVLNYAKENYEYAEREDLKNFIFQIISLIIGFIFFGVIFYIIIKKVANPINDAITNINLGAEGITAASKEVSSSGQSIAIGASDQAASLEEIAASIEEMTAMVKKNTSSTIEANDMSILATKNAKKGISAMGIMSDRINEIRDSSNQTANIVKTIDEIAFQTNLLALNAAVEAARAGEAGKGFAVVAEEVRSLAQRSAKAAKETSDLIESSQENAINGVNAATEVNALIEEISTGIISVSELIEDVTKATKNQSQGIIQINDGVSQLDLLTQANAANAEESAASGEELESQAKELKDVVASLLKVVGGTISK